MKPFDLELAKAGHPVQTRGGRAVRIICYDRLCENDAHIIALIKQDNREVVQYYSNDGRYLDNEEESFLDLFIAPIKREGWVNLFRDLSGSVYSSVKIYATEEDAKKGAKQSSNYYCTTKIEWEE